MLNPLGRATAVLIWVAGIFLPASALDWPKWRGPSGNGITSETIDAAALPKDGPRTLWKAKVGIGFTAVTVSEGVAFSMGNLDKSDTATLFAHDAASGNLKWSREFPSKLAPVMFEGGPVSGPIIDGSRLFTVIKPFEVVCLDARDGKTIWSVDAKKVADGSSHDWGIVAAPLIHGNDLILNYGANGMVLDKRDGKLRWSTGKVGHSFNVPAVANVKGEDQLLVFATNALVAVHLKSGRELWRHGFGEGYYCHSADPIVSGQAVYIGSADHGGELIDFSQGSPRSLWKSRQFGNFMASSVLKDGNLFGINQCDAKQGASELKCVDWKTGEVKWARNDGFGWGGFVMARDQLVILSDKGELSIVAATPEKYELKYRAQVIGGKCWTAPVLANGRLYVRNAVGDLVCLDVGGSKL